MAKKIIRKLFRKLGYEITKVTRNFSPEDFPTMGARWPVELQKRDLELAQEILGKGLTMTSPERLAVTLLAAKHVMDAGIEGDFVECGVWRGGNSILAASLFKSSGQPRLVWCFDTYKGMTEPTEHDRSLADDKFAHEEFINLQRAEHNDWCYSSLEDVKRNFAHFGISENVVFVEGDIAVTLRNPANLPKKISILRLDTDWYESTKLELEILYPRLCTGGVLIIDDYGYWSGAKRAVDEYFYAHGNRPFFQVTDKDGRAAVKCS